LYKKYTQKEYDIIMKKIYPDRLIAIALNITVNQVKMYRRNHKEK